MKKKLGKLFLTLAMILSVVQITNVSANGEDVIVDEISNEDEDSSNEIQSNYVARIGDNNYTSLQEAITNATSGDIIELLNNIDADAEKTGNTASIYEIETSLTINGNGYTISSDENDKIFRIFGSDTEAEIITVNFENVTIIDNVTNGRCIDTRGGYQTLNLTNVTLEATGSGNPQPLTVGGDTSYKNTINIVDSSINAGDTGYGIITFNPVELNIDNSQIKGFAALYFKGPNSSAGSNGTTANIYNDSIIDSTNIFSDGDWNNFGTVVFEDNNITVNVEDSNVQSSPIGECTQFIFLFSSYNFASDNAIVINSGNIILNGVSAVFEVTNGGSNNNITINGGTFNFDVTSYLSDEYTYKQDGDNYIVYPKATSIELNSSSEELNVDDTLQLTAKVLPSGSLDEVVWTSNDSNIATVDQSGRVTGISVGTTVINATIGEITSSCTITVKEEPYIPPYRPSVPSDDTDVSGSTTETGDEVDVDEVTTDSDVRENLGRDNIIATVKVEKADEPVKVTVEAGRDYRDETVYVVQKNVKNELVIVTVTDADSRGDVVFVTESSDELTLTTYLPEGFINDKEENTYYINGDVELVKGWLELEDEWYFFDYETGIQQKERWVAEYDDWYCLDAEGKMLTSTWIWRDANSAYYVDETGLMWYGPATTPDGYTIDENGLWHR